ncbi:MAG TPA: potassium transporter Kup [Ignavibacteria bacterium]|nr:potassium transporter Kup [Ignavibacteria bacterium]
MSSSYEHKGKKYLALLSLTALGVVYGDIGTSPLYALKECFHGPHAIPLTHDNIYGILSLIFWSLILIISIKYSILVLRADNEGEGGILALMALVNNKISGKTKAIIIALALFGAALLYGDGIITPAISILSAVEGLSVATPYFDHFILPITIVIIIILFLFQKKGTSGIGKIFGPITLIWFTTLAVLGISWIIQNPSVLASVNPYWGVNFFIENGFHGFIILGSVFLVVTGGEALYADLGHFGRFPIRAAWFIIVLPGLTLNYFGQGAFLLARPDKVSNPFYNMGPEWALYPMVIIATFAAIIASQAVISGAFSLTFQALQLGYLPRLKIDYTSEKEAGQIYIPRLNYLMCAAVILLVISFETSSNLAAAYGIAVSSTMVTTTILLFIAMTRLWKWKLPFAIAVAGFFFVIDIAFWSSNMLKLWQGGWFPLLFGALIYFIMTTWKHGRRELMDKIQKETQPIENIIEDLISTRMFTIPGTAIYMSSNRKSTPPPLILNIRHHKLLHKQIIILNISYLKVPHVKLEEKIEIENPLEGFYKVIAFYGFMDKTNIDEVIHVLNERGIKVDKNKTTFFLGRESLLVKDKNIFHRLRNKIFVLLSNNSQRATEFFNLPNDKVFEVGTQVEL